MIENERCDNCFTRHRSLPDTCIPAALLGVSVMSRESLTLAEAQAILVDLNTDFLWDDIGPIIDRLEEGYYAVQEDTDATGE